MFVLCPFYFRSLWKEKSAKREEIKKEIFVEPVNDEFSEEFTGKLSHRGAT